MVHPEDDSSLSVFRRMNKLVNACILSTLVSVAAWDLGKMGLFRVMPQNL